MVAPKVSWNSETQYTMALFAEARRAIGESHELWENLRGRCGHTGGYRVDRLASEIGADAKSSARAVKRVRRAC
jgi:hypothetical protein